MRGCGGSLRCREPSRSVRDRDVAGAARVSAPLPETPYVGLVPYSEADAAFFFGREAEKTIVTANLRAARLTLVYGPSGVGKTSLLQAGVVHDLRERAVRHATAGQARAPFAIAVCRNWRDDPMTALMERSARRWRTPAARNCLRGAAATRSSTRCAAGREQARRLLVVLDQFEDYFLYHSSEIGEDTFDFQFPLVVNEPNLRVHFLVSIREDAWAKLDRFEGRIPRLFANYLRVEHLDRDGARAQSKVRSPSSTGALRPARTSTASSRSSSTRSSIRRPPDRETKVRTERRRRATRSRRRSCSSSWSGSGAPRSKRETAS